jgi:hypothetical protein
MRNRFIPAFAVPALLMLSACLPKGLPGPKAHIACVRFGPPPATGTQYGPATNHRRGAVAFVESGIRVQVDTFLYVNGGGTMNTAQIGPPPRPIGRGQTGLANNISYVFNFTGLRWRPSSVDFVYLDMGGFENFAVNGSAPHVGELTAAPPTIGATSVRSVTNPVQGGRSGSVSILGPAIDSVLVGGQEFWIDEVCARG